MSRSRFFWIVLLALGTSPIPAFAASPAHLEVAWISREPRILAPADVKGAVRDGWPTAGSTVHWVAHVINRGTDTVPAVSYTWRIDDQPFETAGTVSVPRLMTC